MNELQQQVNDIQTKLDNFLYEYYRNNSPSSQTFTKKVTLAGGISMNGNSIGSSGDVLSVYGATPVVRAAGISAPATQGAAYVQADVESIVTAVNALRTAVKNFGITA